MKLSEVISELRKLNQPVPVPARLPTEEEVEAAESQLGAKFHEDYRRFLLEAGDVVYGTLEPACVTLDSGHLDLVQMARAAWGEDGVPRDLLPICHDNANYFCLSEAGEIRYWDHNGPTDEKWPSLATWIKQNSNLPSGSVARWDLQGTLDAHLFLTYPSSGDVRELPLFTLRDFVLDGFPDDALLIHINGPQLWPRLLEIVATGKCEAAVDPGQSHGIRLTREMILGMTARYGPRSG